MRIMVNDWAWENSVVANAPVSAVLPWGCAITFEDGLVSCYHTLDCKKLRETEKAIQFEYQASIFSRTSKFLTWKVWIPKSCVKSFISADMHEWFPVGRYNAVETELARLASKGYKAKYSSIVRDTLIPIVKTK